MSSNEIDYDDTNPLIKIQNLDKDKLISQLQEYTIKEQERIAKRKIAQKKYRNTPKGKLANKKAQKKAYKPTGRPKGRPRKVIKKEE